MTNVLSVYLRNKHGYDTYRWFWSDDDIVISKLNNGYYITLRRGIVCILS